MNQALGRSILGREESLRRISRDDCVAWMSGELVPSRLILSASGKVDPDAVLKIAERLFGDMEDVPGTPIGSAEFTGGVRNDRREFEQAHWCLGLPGLRRIRPAHARAGGVRSGAWRRHVVAPVPGAARGARARLFDRRLAAGVRRYGGRGHRLRGGQGARGRNR